MEFQDPNNGSNSSSKNQPEPQQESKQGAAFQAKIESCFNRYLLFNDAMIKIKVITMAIKMKTAIKQQQWGQSRDA